MAVASRKASGDGMAVVTQPARLIARSFPASSRAGHPEPCELPEHPADLGALGRGEVRLREFPMPPGKRHDVALVIVSPFQLLVASGQASAPSFLPRPRNGPAHRPVDGPLRPRCAGRGPSAA